MKYYKILNEKENHKGFQYKTGLNVDTIPFNPTGDCQPGGLYFARENILGFLKYGVWLREVTLPEDAQVYENGGKWKADKIILGERGRITADTVKRLLDEGADPKAHVSSALCSAAKNGYVEIVKLLIPVSDPKACGSAALRLAAENGHIEIVKLLIPVSDPKACGSSALRSAAENGHIEIVKLLIPVSNPKACSSSALYSAAENGHIEIVKLLEKK